MAKSLLESQDLIDLCNQVTYRWSADKLSSEKVKLYKPSSEYATMLRRRLISGKPVPTKPTASQARYGFTEAHVSELQPLLFSAIDSFLADVARSVQQLAPVFSPQAMDVLARR